MSMLIRDAVREAARFEQSLSELYSLFHRTFPEDADLWWNLSISELGHANLLRAGARLFDSEFSREEIDGSVEALVRNNEELESKLESFAEAPLERAEAFRVALELESSTTEGMLHRLFETTASGRTRDLVNRITSEDQSHAELLRSYAEKAGLSL